MTKLSIEKTPEGILLDALSFAAQKHSRQRRKDSEATPYINHPIEAAAILCHRSLQNQPRKVELNQPPTLHRRNELFHSKKLLSRALREIFGMKK